MLSNKWYNFLKWFALIALPAVGTLYASLGNIWNFPYVTQITATILAFDTFIGALIGISTINYNKKGK